MDALSVASINSDKVQSDADAAIIDENKNSQDELE